MSEFKAGAIHTKLQQPEGGKPYIVVPDGFKVENMEKFLGNPAYVESSYSFRSFTDYVRYLKKFNSPASMTFCGLFKMKTIFDYHHFVDGGKLQAGNCKHIAYHRSFTMGLNIKKYNEESGVPPLFL